ncbi:MAG: RDD family protein [Mariprofundaceae bacterium]
MAETARPKAKTAGITVRLCAAAYDLTILFGLEFFVFIPVTIVEQYLAPVPDWIKGLLLMSVAYAYFVGFWLKGATTTGMRPWKLRVAMANSGEPITFTAATARFFGLMLTWLALGLTLFHIATRNTGTPVFFIAGSIPALSLLLMLLTVKKQSLHDIIAGTSIFRLQKESPV